MSKLKNFKVKAVGFGKKYGTDIAVYGGSAAIVAGVVLACKATLKVNTEAEEDAKKADEIRAKYKLEKKVKGGKKDARSNSRESRELVELHKEGNRALLKHNTRCIGRYVRHYSVPALLIGGGIAGSIWAHGKEKSEKNAAVAYAAGLAASLKKYRDEMRRERGEEAEKKFFYDVKEEKKETVDEKGKKKTEVVETVDKDVDRSDFAKYFGVDYSTAATGYAEADLMFLKQVEITATRKLREDKWLTLNELYKMLRLVDGAGQRYGVKGGNNIGWVYDKDDPDGNKVDLGIYNPNKVANRDYVNGYNDVILIEPNVNCLDLGKAMWGLDMKTPDPDLFRD